MGNVQTVWSAVTVGESILAIEELCRQMTSVHTDLEIVDQQINHHHANLDRDVIWIKQVKDHSNFMASRVTVLEGDWGTGRFSKHLALLERMDKQVTMIQDLREQVAILQGNRYKCFNAGSGLSVNADGELDYEDDKGVEVQPPWSSILPMLTEAVV